MKKELVIDVRGKEYTITTAGNFLVIESENQRKAVKVEDDSEYTYKILKTKIKAIGGADGLYDFMYKNSKGCCMLCLVWKIIEEAFYNMRAAKF